jgi:hypothetical protein
MTCAAYFPPTHDARACRPTETTTYFVAPSPKKFVDKDDGSTKNMVNTRVELAALAFLAEAISTTL